MKKFTLQFIFILTLFELTGCSSMVATKNDQVVEAPAKVFKASGAGNIQHLPQLTELQNQLASEQIAKLNAYRSLAKQLYKEKLSDKLFVADQVIKDELYRTYLDLFIREARVVESKNIADQKKVVLELLVPSRFYQCLSASVEVVSRCLREDNKVPFTRLGYQQATKSTVNLSCAAVDCGARISMSGFSSDTTGLDKTLLDLGLYDSEWSANMAIRSFIQYVFPTGFLLN